MGKGEKMAFEVINTQEELDAVIGERLKRQKDKLEEQYKGFISPDTMNEKISQVRAEYEGHLSPDEVKKKYEGWISPEEASKKDSQIKAYETNSVKMKVAGEMGIPLELASKLSGDDEDSIRKDAEAVSKYIKAPQSAPLATNEPENIDDKRAAIKNMLSNLEGE